MLPYLDKTNRYIQSYVHPSFQQSSLKKFCAADMKSQTKQNKQQQKTLVLWMIFSTIPRTLEGELVSQIQTKYQILAWNIMFLHPQKLVAIESVCRLEWCIFPKYLCKGLLVHTNVKIFFIGTAFISVLLTKVFHWTTHSNLLIDLLVLICFFIISLHFWQDFLWIALVHQFLFHRLHSL